MFKKSLMPLAVLAALLLPATPALACGADKQCGGVCSSTVDKAPAKAVAGEIVTTVFQVSGMKCQNCANGVTNKLREVAGVAQVDVNLAAHTATVKHAKGQAGLDALNAALKGHFKLAAATAPAAAPAAGAAPAECHTAPAAPKPKAETNTKGR